MSFHSRLKERREQLNMTQTDLAVKLNITKGAIGNYETGRSSPKAEILYKVFDVLSCDANFLFQDEMDELASKNSVSSAENELLKKYRSLDDYGKDTVLLVLDREFTRSSEQLESSNNPSDEYTTIQIAEFQDKEAEPEEVITQQAEPPEEETSSRPILRAAHRNEATYTEEGAQADYAKMAELKKKYLKK